MDILTLPISKWFFLFKNLAIPNISPRTKHRILKVLIFLNKFLLWHYIKELFRLEPKGYSVIFILNHPTTLTEMKMREELVSKSPLFATISYENMDLGG